MPEGADEALVSAGRRVVLGVTGGIAAYKACEIVRAFDRAGVATRVVMTRSAARFVTPLALQTLSRQRVLQDTFDLEGERTVGHIETAHWAEALLIAPATANTLAKLARGVADDLLTTIYLAVTAPVIVAPAANPRMLQHPSTRTNLAVLRSRGVEVIDPETGWLAENEIGWGRMADPARIVAATLVALRRTRQLEGRRIVVTAGPTRERIDPVRFLSNRSSGKMGYALAAACAQRGAEVTLISGPVELGPPHGVKRISVETSAEMREAVLEARRGAAAVFMAAAVADWLPRAVAGKLKRSGSPLTLVLDEGPDILAEMGRQREEDILVGFAAETEQLLAHARAKLQRKGLDYIVANDVSLPGLGFDAEENQVTLIDREDRQWVIGPSSKREVAEQLLDRIFGAEGGAAR